MALSDYLKGPAHQRRAQELEGQLAELQERHAQLKVLAEKYGDMEMLEIKLQINKENARLASVQQSIQSAERHVAALRDLQSRLDKAATEEQRASLLEKFAELEAAKAKLDGEEKFIDYREKNAKAGYVYVISNVGAFGEAIYKIGMTRRLEPMHRVDELGDASVPFWFDVHAMVFSDNAPALEEKLHEHFASGRLNKVNARREFFRADIAEIEAIIRENYDAAVEVSHEAPAEQYRESLRMAIPVGAIQQVEPAVASN